MAVTGLRPAPTRTVLLGARAAASCPVKTAHDFDPTAKTPVTDAEAAPLPGPALQARAAEARLLEALVSTAPGLVVDLRLLAEDPTDSTAACVQAMTVGAAVIVGGTLPVDEAGHRVGRPDVLLRGADSPTGRPTYHPVAVVGHKVLLSPRPPTEGDPPTPPSLHGTPLSAPGPAGRRPLAGLAFRLRSREADLLRLAHHHRMLEAAGFAAAEPLAAVLGTDIVPQGPVLVWVDLAAPRVRTYSRRSPEGWRLRSELERYDHEQQLRVRVAEAARQRTGGPQDPTPLVVPVVQDECARCRWWQRCRPQLGDDDVSLRIDKGALDVREVLALRRLGRGTVDALADADLDQLLPAYLPLTGHRGGAESRLRVAARRARMLRDAVAFDRETSGPIEVPGAQLEVDLDIESSAEGRVYLWGFLVSDTTSAAPPSYHPFGAFGDLDEAAETALAGRAFGWLRALAEQASSLRVYHYSSYEPFTVRALAERTGDDRLTWAAGCVEEHFVDLYDVVRTHYFGVNGLGLKPIAQHAGFRWRDDDPGGLNSQRWFADAVHALDPEVRESARRRVLEYNEDDVLATWTLRAWLRSR